MRAQINSTSCCGLKIIDNFNSKRYDWGWGGRMTPAKIKKRDVLGTNLAYISVTRWCDVSQKAKLKAWGFKSVGRWKNPNTGRVLTLWAYIPKKKGK